MQKYLGFYLCELYFCCWLYLSAWRGMCVCIYISVYLTVCQSVYLSVCLSVYLPVCLFLCTISISLSICLYVYLSIVSVWGYSCLKILWLCYFLRLAIGTDQGLSVVDTITNKCLYILSNLTSILCKHATLYTYPFCSSLSPPTYVQTWQTKM